MLRRRYPLAVAVYLSAHMFVTGVTMPEVMGQVALQICYFMGLFSAMAWGRSRRSALLVTSTILVFMLCWVAWQFAVGQSAQAWLDDAGRDERYGFLPPIPAIILLIFSVNVVYFLGAIVGGQVAWRGARQREALAEQADTIVGRPPRCNSAPSSTSDCGSPASCTTSSATTSPSSASRPPVLAGCSTATRSPSPARSA